LILANQALRAIQSCFAVCISFVAFLIYLISIPPYPPSPVVNFNKIGNFRKIPSGGWVLSELGKILSL
jgi:hypothetical protein